MNSLNAVGFHWLHQFAGRWPLLDDLGIFFANWLAYLLVIAFLVLVWYQPTMRRRFYLFVEGTLAVILARGILTTAIRYFYFHPRPFAAYGFTPLISESGSSFPSGHMTWFFALAMIVWYANRKWGWWFFVLAALIGIARIYVGVHWPYDIIGGAVIGIASGLFIHAIIVRFRPGLRPAE